MVDEKPKKRSSVERFKITRSIKTKFIAIMSVLVVVLMISTAWFLVVQKKKELTRDIYVNARNYAELTAGEIIDAYETYYEQSGFVQFNRVMQSLFRQSEDVSRVTLVRFNGEVLYDSETEQLKKYDSTIRSFESNPSMMERLQAPFPSVNISGQSRVVYLEKDTLGQTFEVNLQGKKVDPIEDGQRIGTVVQPVDQKYALLYQVSYSLLDQRLLKTYAQIALLLLAGITFGFGVAIMISNHLARPIKSLTEGAKEIAGGNFDHRVNVRTRDELGLLSSAFNQMAKDLKESTKALIYKERVAKELEIAKTIQDNLIPKQLPQIDGLDIAASVDPAAEIGGDCYDFIQMDENKTLMYLGDVTGHGVPAGLLVSVANAMIYAFRGMLDMVQILTQTNAIIQAKSQPNMFITLVMLTWDKQGQLLEYVSAGHEKLIHFNGATGQVAECESGGIAIGMVPDCSKLLKKMPIQFNQGDVVIAYSDGVPEAWGKGKEQYSMPRLKRVFMEAASKQGATAESIRETIEKDVHVFMGQTPQADDITIMVLKKV